MPNLTDTLSRQARVRGPAAAVIAGAHTLGFAAFDAIVWRVATALARAGFVRGLVVAVTFRDEFAHLVTACALARLGATQVPLPEREPPQVRAGIAAATGVAVLLTDVEHGADAGVPRHVFDVRAAGSEGAPIDPGVRDPHPSAPWLMMHGSGTTGRAKVMPLSHMQWLARLQAQRTLLGLRAGEPALCMGTIDFATTRHRYLETLATGGTIVLFDRQRDGLLYVHRRHHVRVLYASTMHLQQLVDWLPDDAHHVLQGLRVLRVGNSHVSEPLRARALRSLTPHVYVAYSTNEFGPVTVAPPDDIARHPGTVGRPAPGVEIRVLDPSGRPVPPGTPGQIALRGPGCIDGYLNDAQATATSFRDGWFQPGDVGTQLADGQLIHSGRSDDMMIFDGINISPTEIENVMSAHPAVAQAVAFAVPSRVHHHWPVCALTLNPGAHADADTLRAFASERLGMRAPRQVVVIDAIPRTDSGKPLRRALAEHFAAPSPSIAQGAEGAPGPSREPGDDERPSGDAPATSG